MPDLFNALVSGSERDKPGETMTYYGVATSDSNEGIVSVAMDGFVVGDPDLEDTEITIPVDDFKDGRFQLDPSPSEGTVRVIAHADLYDEELSVEDFTIDADGGLVIPALSGALGVAITYRGSFVQALEPNDIMGSSAMLQGTPVDVVSATRISTIDGTEEAIEYAVDGATITFPGIDVDDHSYEASYRRDVSLALSEEILEPYTPSEHEEPITGARWSFELPDVPESIALFTTQFDSSSGASYAETDAYVLEGAALYIIAESEQYLVSYSVRVSEAFSSADLEGGAYALEAEPMTLADESSTLVLTKDGEAFQGFTITENVLTIQDDSDSDWWVQLDYEADVSLDLSTDDFTEGRITLPGNPDNETIHVYVNGTEVEFEYGIDASGNGDDTITVPTLIRTFGSFTVTYTGLREDNVVQLTTGPSVRAGETVTVQVVNGMPMVVSSAGSGDRQESNIEEALTVGANALDVSEAAQAAADEAEAIANAVNQHFWTDSDGVHITEETQSNWNDSSSSGYHRGANAILNALGLLFRSGLINLAQFAPGGIALYDGQGNLAANIVAQFTEDEISLGINHDSATIDLVNGTGTISKGSYGALEVLGSQGVHIGLNAGGMAGSNDATVIDGGSGTDAAAIIVGNPMQLSEGHRVEIDANHFVVQSWDRATLGTSPYNVFMVLSAGQLYHLGGTDMGQYLDLHTTDINSSATSIDSAFTQDYVCRIRPSNTGGNLGIYLNEVGTTNIVHYLLNNGTGRLLYRTSSDGGTTWSSQKGVRSPWTSLGSFTGSNSLTIDLTDYDELMVVAKFSSKVFAANLPKAALTTSNQEWWLGGGKDETGTANSGSARALVNVTTTRITGVAANNGSSSVLGSTTFTVYAR